MNSARFPIAVVMQRQRTAGRQTSWRWEARGVTASGGDLRSARVLHEDEAVRLVLFDGVAVELDRDHVDRYVRNLNAPHPKVFVAWCLQDDEPQPHSLEVNCHEPVRHPVAAERVDAVPMPVGLAAWVAEFVQAHYREKPVPGPDSHTVSVSRPGHAAR